MKIYNISMLTGFSLSVISILTSSIGDLFNVSFDLDPDINGVLPFNMSCFCLGLMTFGITGRFTLSKSNVIVSLIVAIIISLAIYKMFYNGLVLKLKRNNPKVMSTRDIRGQIGKVTLKIQRGMKGTIEVTDNTGAKISYIAKMYNDEVEDVIEEGESVLIMKYDTETNTCFVYKINNMEVDKC